MENEYVCESPIFSKPPYTKNGDMTIVHVSDIFSVLPTCALTERAFSRCRVRVKAIMLCLVARTETKPPNLSFSLSNLRFLWIATIPPGMLHDGLEVICSVKRRKAGSLHQSSGA